MKVKTEMQREVHLNDSMFIDDLLRQCQYNVTQQASTLTYFLTCPFGQLTKKNTCPTQFFNCPKQI